MMLVIAGAIFRDQSFAIDVDIGSSEQVLLGPARMILRTSSSVVAARDVISSVCISVMSFVGCVGPTGITDRTW